MLDPTSNVHEDTGRRNEALAVVQVAVGHRPVECINVLAHGDGSCLAGLDPLRIFRGFFPLQYISPLILGMEIQDIPGVIHDLVITRRPN